MNNDSFADGIAIDKPEKGLAFPVEEGVAVTEDETAESISDDGRPCLSENVNSATVHLEESFIFRKMGIVFDYASRPGDFPRAALPKKKDIESGKPNVAGIGTGIGECLDNTCLLLDGYLTRIELGISQGNDERIMDRLIAGLIRLGTVSQRKRIVRGFTPDGRFYYNSYSAINCTYYAHGLLRAFETPTVSPESQIKLRDIGNKWMLAFKSNNFEMPGIVNEKNILIPLDSMSEEKRWENRIRIIHLIAVMQHMKKGNWDEMYKEYAFDEGGDFKVKAVLPETLTDSAKLMSLQIALSDLARLKKEGAEITNINLLRKKISFRCLNAIKNFTPPTLAEDITEATLDWREDLVEGNVTLGELKNRTKDAWPRIKEEMDMVFPAISSALCVMLSGDEDLIKEYAGFIEKIIAGVEWSKLWTATSIAPLLLVHALGHEYSLWDYSCERLFENKKVGNTYGCEFNEENKIHNIDAAYIAKNYKSRDTLYPAFLEKQENKNKSKGSKFNRNKKNNNKNRNRRNRRRKQNNNNPNNDSNKK